MLKKRLFWMMALIGVMFVFALSGCDFLNGDEDENGDPFTVKNADGWNNALDAIKKGGKDKEYTVTVNGSFSVPSSKFTFGINNSGITVTLQGNGTISLSNAGSLLDIYSNQTVIVKDLTLRGFSANNSPVVNCNGNFRMEGSASVTGNTGGCGVYMSYGHNKTFTMQDNASVTGNTSSSNHSGGGVYVGSGTNFIMKDNASVSGNTSTGSGGGVLISTGTFTMQGGTVSNNTSPAGGGVFVGSSGSKAAFVMQGGSVSDNISNGRGGGIYVFYNWGSFNMQGGTVSGNSANGNGGGIYLSGRTGTFGDFTKNGGIIYGNSEGINSNTASSQGHAVYQYDVSNSRWRNSTAGQDINTANNDFWSND